MAAALRLHEKAGDALPRLVRKYAQRALAVTNGERVVDDSPVHATRKNLKKARAALWLLQDELGKTRYRQLDRTLRDVGRLISEVRDAEVRLETVRELERIAHRRGGFRKLEELFILELENFISAFAGWQKEARVLLEKFLEEFERVDCSGFDDRKLERAMKVSYKSARNAFLAACEAPNAEIFHEFRAMAKRLMYQLQLLRPANPVVVGNLVGELKTMAELLGRAHDFNFLGLRVHQMQGAAPDQEARNLSALIQVSEEEFQRSAAEISGRFFAERPRDFGERVTTWLGHWRDGKAPAIAHAIFDSRV